MRRILPALVLMLAACHRPAPMPRKMGSYVTIPSGAASGTTPPVTMDGTGLPTTIPLTVTNGKDRSGIELKATGTAQTGLMLRDASNVERGALGYARVAGDWVANSRAGDVVLTGDTGVTVKANSSSTTGVRLLSPSSTGINSSGYILVDDSSGTTAGFGASTQMQMTLNQLTMYCTGTFGIQILSATNQKLGFWGKTPVVQQSSTGETVGFTTGAGTAVKDDSTFTGNQGATAYRLSDVVKHLKTVGILAQ